MYVKREQYVSFACSADGTEFIPVGRETEASPGRWVGVKTGLFAINETGKSGGCVQIGSYLYERKKE